VLAEGAGIAVLEEYEHAKKPEHRYTPRSSDTRRPTTEIILPRLWRMGQGRQLAMELALKDAQVSPDKVDYVNAHGTGTELNDIAESAAIRTVLGPHAYK